MKRKGNVVRKDEKYYKVKYFVVEYCFKGVRRKLVSYMVKVLV